MEGGDLVYDRPRTSKSVNRGTVVTSPSYTPGRSMSLSGLKESDIMFSLLIVSGPLLISRQRIKCTLI